jgi:short-subunit dehydrogenase|tara:strand:+ start:385 stop:792 length:408 start_codon:yes stop_codon:yes gene_type:complete
MNGSVVLAAIVFAVFGSYWIPKLVVSLMPTQDLKRKYDAQWALVTGSSSGIGKSLASRLASQGLNIVMVALNDRLLDDAVSELKTTFKSGQFIKVGVDLGVPGYLDIIAEATKDLDVQIVFNNAGFMLTGFFDKQ